MGNSGKVKKYILDTSVLLHDPHSLYSFDDNEVYIPLKVLEELDHHKIGSEEKNVNARQAARTLDELTEKSIPKEGISLSNGGRLFFLENDSVHGYGDDIILQKALDLYHNSKEDDRREVILVTKDINLRIRSRIKGLTAQDYLHDKAATDIKYFFERPADFLDVGNALISEIYAKNFAEVPDYLSDKVSRLQINQYLVLRENKHEVLVKYKQGKFVKIKRDEKIENITPRNMEQCFLLDACLDEDLRIVSVLGKAGTGKTLIALAAGIHLVTDSRPEYINSEGLKRTKRNEYHKLVVFRPIQESGKGLGFLPGSLEEKINPYFKPVNTALQLIMGPAGADYSQHKYIDCSPLNFIRGDTLHNSFIIVDEAQNYTPAELKLIGTRVADSSKLVILGDPYQTDNPYLDERSNGLSLVADKLRKKVPEFGMVILNKVERGRVAEIFAEYL